MGDDQSLDRIELWFMRVGAAAIVSGIVLGALQHFRNR
jgi:hypothetical protein